jgi:hypothetical protein
MAPATAFDTSGLPEEVYDLPRLNRMSRVLVAGVLVFFLGFAAFSSADRMSGGQRALAVGLGVALAAAIFLLTRRRVEVWTEGVRVRNYLTTFEVRWSDIGELRVIPAGLEVWTKARQRHVATVLARWNWKPYFGADRTVGEIATALAGRAGARRVN